MKQTYKQELADLGSIYITSVTTYRPSLGAVSLPVPAEGWEQSKRQSDDPAEQAAMYERYSAQKVSSENAGHVVKDLHLASNAETAVNGEHPLPTLLIIKHR